MSWRRRRRNATATWSSGKGLESAPAWRKEAASGPVVMRKANALSSLRLSWSVFRAWALTSFACKR